MSTIKSSFLHDTFSVFSNNILILILSLVTSILLARYLGPDGRGIYAGLLVYPILLTGLAELGVRQATVYLVGKKDYATDQIIGSLLWCMIASSFISIIIVAGVFLYIQDPDFSWFMIVLALLYIPFRIIVSYSQGIFLGGEEIRRFNQLNWIPPMIILIGMILLTVLAQLYVIGAVIATLAGSACMGLYALRLLSHIAPLNICFNPDIIKKLLSIGVVYGVALFILQLNYKIDIVLMQQLSTASEIGQYSVGVSIAELLWQIPSAVGVIIFSRSANAKEPELFSKNIIMVFRVTFIGALAGGLCLFLIAPYLMPLLYGPAFAPSVLVIQLILPGIIIMAAAKVLNMDLAGKGKPNISLIAFFPAVILNIVLNIFWIPVYGANGAAMATTVSYGIGSSLFLFLYSRELNIPIKEILQYKMSDFDFICGYLTKKS